MANENDSHLDAPATKRDLLEMGTELRTEFKQDFLSLRTEFKQDLLSLKTELESSMLSLAERLESSMLTFAQRLERAETTLLTEFRTYRNREQIRTRAIELRLADLETRTDEIEQRLPPTS